MAGRIRLIGILLMVGSLALPWAAYQEAPLPPRWAVLDALRERGWGAALAIALLASVAALLLRPVAPGVVAATIGLLLSALTALTVPQPTYSAMGRDDDGQFWEIRDAAQPTQAAWLFVLGAAVVLGGSLLRRRPSPAATPTPAPPPG